MQLKCSLLPLQFLGLNVELYADSEYKVWFSYDIKRFCFTDEHMLTSH